MYKANGDNIEITVTNDSFHETLINIISTEVKNFFSDPDPNIDIKIYTKYLINNQIIDENNIIQEIINKYLKDQNKIDITVVRTHQDKFLNRDIFSKYRNNHITILNEQINEINNDSDDQIEIIRDKYYENNEHVFILKHNSIYYKFLTNNSSDFPFVFYIYKNKKIYRFIRPFNKGFDLKKMINAVENGISDDDYGEYKFYHAEVLSKRNDFKSAFLDINLNLEDINRPEPFKKITE